MGAWLVEHFTVFGVPAQNWMLIALALILIGIILAWRPHR
jgi:cbb3-type cytochrome oxidase subunit 3